MKYLPPLGHTKFVEHEDTPNSYSGEGGKIIQVKSSEDGLEFVPKPTGDMSKSVYDANDNGVVDNSEKLGGKTLSEVQNHPPKWAQILLPLLVFTANENAISAFQLSSLKDDSPSYYFFVINRTESTTYLLVKYKRLSNGSYVYERYTSFTADSNASPIGVCQHGNYVYVSLTTNGGIDTLYRFTLDLTGPTTMTFSGTTGHGNLCSDGTYIYMLVNSNTVRYYSITDTTASSVGYITLGANVRTNGVFFTDGTYLYAIGTDDYIKRFYISTGNQAVGYYYLPAPGSYSPYLGLVKLDDKFAIAYLPRLNTATQRLYNIIVTTIDKPE